MKTYVPLRWRSSTLTTRLLVLTGLAVLTPALLYVPSVGPAHAEPYKRESDCGKSRDYHGHVKVPASGGHYADVAVRVCHNGSIVKWASNPVITFPSYKMAGLLAPQAALETVSATKPVIYSTAPSFDGVSRVTWRFTVTVKALRGGIPIATETYYFRTYPAYMELAGHGHTARAKWSAG